MNDSRTLVKMFKRYPQGTLLICEGSYRILKGILKDLQRSQILRDPAKILKDPALILKDVAQILRVLKDIWKDRAQLLKDPVQILRDLAQILKDPVQILRDPVGSCIGSFENHFYQHFKYKIHRTEENLALHYWDMLFYSFCRDLLFSRH